MRQYLYKGKIYTLELCTLDDLDSHYSKIVSTYPFVESDDYKDRMAKCITEGSAYKLSKGSLLVAFVYLKVTHKEIAEGVSFYCPSQFYVLMIGKFLTDTTPIQKYIFQPHTNTPTITSLCTRRSIVEFHSKRTPLIIMIPRVLGRFKDMYNRLGVEEL